MRTLILALLGLLVACSDGPNLEAPPAEPSPSDVAPAPAAPTVDAPPPRRVPVITSPSELRGSPRFAPDGILVHDMATGKTWYASDVANTYAGFDATAECAGFGAGYRPATSSEVEALGAPLPEAFHSVYAWASHANLSFFPDTARPIVTSAGCVDIRTATAFADDCAMPGVPKLSRSTMCLHD